LSPLDNINNALVNLKTFEETCRNWRCLKLFRVI